MRSPGRCGGQARYCSSLTFSIQSTVLPSSASCDRDMGHGRGRRRAVPVLLAGRNQTTSPGRISSFGPPSSCTQPQPAVTISVWPSGCVCQAVRAPGSKVTMAPPTRAGSGALNSGIDPHRAGEILRRPLLRRLRAAALDLHGWFPFRCCRACRLPWVLCACGTASACQRGEHAPPGAAGEHLAPA